MHNQHNVHSIVLHCPELYCVALYCTVLGGAMYVLCFAPRICRPWSGLLDGGLILPSNDPHRQQHHCQRHRQKRKGAKLFVYLQNASVGLPLKELLQQLFEQIYVIVSENLIVGANLSVPLSTFQYLEWRGSLWANTAPISSLISNRGQLTPPTIFPSQPSWIFAFLRPDFPAINSAFLQTQCCWPEKTLT